MTEKRDLNNEVLILLLRSYYTITMKNNFTVDLAEKNHSTSQSMCHRKASKKIEGNFKSGRERINCFEDSWKTS